MAKSLVSCFLTHGIVVYMPCRKMQLKADAENCSGGACCCHTRVTLDSSE